MPKRLLVLCLFVTGCTTIQQDQAEMASREPAAVVADDEEEMTIFVRLNAWKETKAALGAGQCPDLRKVAPNAWRIFGQFWQETPELRPLNETLKKLMEGTGVTIRSLPIETARARYAAQTKDMAIRGPHEYFLIQTPHKSTLLGINPSSSPVDCRAVPPS